MNRDKPQMYKKNMTIGLGMAGRVLLLRIGSVVVRGGADRDGHVAEVLVVRRGSLDLRGQQRRRHPLRDPVVVALFGGLLAGGGQEAGHGRQDGSEKLSSSALGRDGWWGVRWT